MNIISKSEVSKIMTAWSGNINKYPEMNETFSAKYSTLTKSNADEINVRIKKMCNQIKSRVNATSNISFELGLANLTSFLDDATEDAAYQIKTSEQSIIVYLGEYFGDLFNQSLTSSEISRMANQFINCIGKLNELEVYGPVLEEFFKREKKIKANSKNDTKFNLLNSNNAMVI